MTKPEPLSDEQIAGMLKFYSDPSRETSALCRALLELQERRAREKADPRAMCWAPACKEQHQPYSHYCTKHHAEIVS